MATSLRVFFCLLYDHNTALTAVIVFKVTSVPDYLPVPIESRRV